MPKITLNSASFHGFKFTCGPKRGAGAPMVIAEFSAPWTEANRKTGKWQEIPETVSGSVHLVPAELAASVFTFTPRGFEKQAISLDASGADGFLCFCPTKEGEVRELRFTISTASDKAGRTLEAAGHVFGEAQGKLVISYDEQADIPLISKEQAADTASTN